MQPWLLTTAWGSLPTYPAAMVAGFFAATLILRRETRRAGLSDRAVADATAVAILAGALGARTWHVLIEAPTFYLMDPLAALSPAAGWTWLGGLLGGLVGAGLFVRAQGVPAGPVLDVLATAIPFGQAVARLGCLGAGCCHGRPAGWPFGGEVPWSITYHAHGSLPDALLAVPLHPAPLYLSLMNIGVFIGVSAVRSRSTVPGRAVAALLVLGGIGRAVLEPFRGDVERGLFFGDLVSASQLGGAGMALVGVVAWWRLGR